MQREKRSDEESTQAEVLQRDPKVQENACTMLRGMDGNRRKMASEWCTEQDICQAAMGPPVIAERCRIPAPYEVGAVRH